MPRKRVLSELGCELFNVPFNNDFPIRKSCIDFKTIFTNLMTTDFDIKLQKNQTQMIKATTKMYSYLDGDKQNQIGVLVNNAITNIIILVLTDGSKLCSLQQIKMNIYFYIRLADNLYKSGDHNSAIIIRAALSNSCITSLKVKLKQKHKDIFKKFEKEYGTFINCHASHLRKILENNDCEKFFPSLMVLMTHLNKTKEYIKSYHTIGKFPKTLLNTEDKLNSIANKYYNRYRNTNELLLQLYTNNTLNYPIMKKYKCYNERKIGVTLHDISYNIKKSIKKRHSII